MQKTINEFSVFGAKDRSKVYAKIAEGKTRDQFLQNLNDLKVELFSRSEFNPAPAPRGLS